MIAPIPDLLIQPVIAAALAEDLGRAGDVTAQACIDAEARLSAVFGARAGRAAAQAADPGTRPERCQPTPDLPAKALAQLRLGMTRDAGVVRDAAGLTRLIGEIGALEQAHGKAPPLVAARLVAQAALDRPASLGAHFRSDGVQDAAPKRTFVPLREPACQAA